MTKHACTARLIGASRSRMPWESTTTRHISISFSRPRSKANSRLINTHRVDEALDLRTHTARREELGDTTRRQITSKGDSLRQLTTEQHLHVNKAARNIHDTPPELIVQCHHRNNNREGIRAAPPIGRLRTAMSLNKRDTQTEFDPQRCVHIRTRPQSRSICM